MHMELPPNVQWQTLIPDLEIPRPYTQTTLLAKYRCDACELERAEWLLLMNIKCKLLAMAGGFTRAISQGLFPEVLFPNFCTSTVYATPRDVGRSELSRSLSDVSEARGGKGSAPACCVCALSIHRLEGRRSGCGGRGPYANSMLGRSGQPPP